MKETGKHLARAIVLSAITAFAASLLQSKTLPAKKLQHVVAFNYKPEITTGQKQKIKEAFYALQKDIPQIKAFQGGDDIKPNNKKFSQCFVVTVKDEHDLEVYGSHPRHKAFSAMVDPMLAEVMVVDYWTN